MSQAVGSGIEITNSERELQRGEEIAARRGVLGTVVPTEKRDEDCSERIRLRDPWSRTRVTVPRW